MFSSAIAKTCPFIVDVSFYRFAGTSFSLRLLTTNGAVGFSAKRMMRAVFVREFGGPEVLNIADNVEVPTCHDKQVLIRVMAAGVNPVDTYIRSGTYARKPKLPYIPGSDASGVVEKIGSEVTKFKKGDRVFCTRHVDGSYAEYCTVVEDSCWNLPDRLTFNQGAAIGVPYFTAYRALFHKAHAKPSHTLLVHGASGAVGLAAVQLAKASGMTVIGTAGTQDGLAIVKNNGAHYVFSHKEQNYCSKIMEITQNEGVDIILEMLSNVNLAKDLSLLKQDGVVAVVGCRGSVEINPRLLMGKESSIIGVSLMSAKDAEWMEMGAAICSGLERGSLTPVIHKEYPLEKVAQAHKDIIESAGAKGKLVLAIASQC